MNTSLSPQTTPRPARTRRHGFTLIELLSVVVIMAILVGVIASGLAASTRAAREAAIRSNEEVLTSALSHYTASGGVITGSDNLSTVIDKLTDSGPVGNANITGPFLGTTVPMTMVDGDGVTRTLNVDINQHQFTYE